MTVEDEILEAANLTRDIANKMRMVNKVLDGAARTWEIGRPNPGNDKMSVLAMFFPDDEGSVPGDVRVYSVPLVNDLPFACYTVNRVHPGFSSEGINDRDTFLDDVAAELSALAVTQGLLEECPKCETPNRPDASECIECAYEFPDEDEEDTAVNAATTVPDAPGPVGPTGVANV